ncbi:MAG: ATP phosphoribosyltransferase regulatory subunit [Clostridia bacterium]|nr:ATP phosphoribosyltransferase regulatory subunit [Clostridia bacterium]
MNKFKNIPYGLQDYLPLEYSLKENIENKILSSFKNAGYQMIETPILEYMDVFSISDIGFAAEDMFKLSDSNGSLLVLRPDITMPIARMAATKLSDKDLLKLCYCGNVFHLKGEKKEGYKQVTQIGIELMGDQSASADAECLILAINSLREAGLNDFQIEIGQTDFFKGLMIEAGLNESDSEQIRRFVEMKDMLSIEIMLDEKSVDLSIKNDILELPTLYGGIEILDSAKKYSKNPLCKKAIDNIEKVLSILKEYQLLEYISIDLSIVQSVHYYTGIVFKGICPNLGYPLLTGGRYDNLIKNYGKDMPAVGFAMTSKHILIALEREGKLI